MDSISVNRKLAPELKDISDISIPEANKGFLDNKIPMVSLNSGDQDVLKMELIFPSGTVFEPSKAIAVTTNNLLDEGTNKHNSKEIAERFEYYGASIEKHTSFDYSSIILYTLSKHLEKTLPLLLEVITEANFPEKELQSYITRKKHQLSINLEKVEHVVRKEFMKLLFGANHPYGYETTLSDYDNIHSNDLKTYYNRAFALDHCKIIISGKVNDKIIKSINEIFGSSDLLTGNKALIKKKALKLNGVEKHILHIPKAGAIQSGIRVGKVLFNKTHSDYFELSVLNTILGGYFGSRLMSNIREDKGYTYGIGSGLVSYLDSGYFFISTQVGVDVYEDTLKEIYKEMERLKTNAVPEKELELVKKYMQGSFVRSMDGPFALANTFKSLMLYDLDYTFLYDYLSVIQSVTPQRLTELANTYFNNLNEVVAGLKQA